MTLCTLSLLPYFRNLPGYNGGLYIDNPFDDCTTFLDEVPEYIRCIVIEDDPFLMRSFLNSPVAQRTVARVALLHGAEQSIPLLTELAVQHYDTVYHHTNTHLLPNEARGLAHALFTGLLQRKGEPLRGMEIGSALGASTYVAANVLRMFSPASRLYCVDPWQYWVSRVDRFPFWVDRAKGPFRAFLESAAVFAFEDIVRPMKMTSDEAFAVVGMNTLDFVFIDASHAYSAVYPEILHAVLLVKIGGVVAGHDCDCYADAVDHKHMEENKENQFVFVSSNVVYHYGVIKATSDIFGKKHSIFPESTVWYKIIDHEDKEKALELISLLEMNKL